MTTMEEHYYKLGQQQMADQMLMLAIKQLPSTFEDWGWSISAEIRVRCKITELYAELNAEFGDYLVISDEMNSIDADDLLDRAIQVIRSARTQG